MMQKLQMLAELFNLTFLDMRSCVVDIIEMLVDVSFVNNCTWEVISQSRIRLEWARSSMRERI